MNTQPAVTNSRTGASQAAFDARAIYVRNTAVVSREIAGETIVVPICRGVGDMDSVYTFNEVGTELWQLLAEAHNTESLVEWVGEHFEVTREVALGDVQAFLGELLQVGLIRPA
jgi:coenzyme PQQ synthesis protein D (PqqD)